jgi:hypothetical protein
MRILKGAPFGCFLIFITAYLAWNQQVAVMVTVTSYRSQELTLGQHLPAKPYRLGKLALKRYLSPTNLARLNQHVFSLCVVSPLLCGVSSGPMWDYAHLLWWQMGP